MDHLRPPQFENVPVDAGLRFPGLGVFVPILLLLLFANHRDACSQANPLQESWRWIRFGIESGLPSEAVENVVDVPGGDLWAHTAEGVAWYDGYRWHPSLPDSGAEPDYVGAALFESGGKVLLSSARRLFLVDRQGIRPVNLAHHGLPLNIEKAVPFGQDGLLLQTDSLLFLLRNGVLTPFDSPFSDPVTHHAVEKQFGLLGTGRGTVWLNVPAGLYRWDGRSWVQRMKGAERFLIIHSIVEDVSGDGLLSVHTNSGNEVFEWRGEGPMARQPTLSGDVGATMDISPAGEAIATFVSGEVWFRSAGTWSQLRPVPDPLRNCVESRFRANGDLWVATSSGLYLCRRSSGRWTYWKDDSNDRRNNINEILHARDGTFWLATGVGLIVRHPDGRIEEIRSINGRLLGPVTAVAEDREHNVWVASGESFEGAYRWDGKTWRHIWRDQGLMTSYVHKITRDRQGRLWFLGISRLPGGVARDLEPGAFLYDSGTFRRMGKVDGLLDDRVYAMVEDRQGALWFGTLDGLSRRKDSTWTYWRTEDGLRLPRVFALAIDCRDRLWFVHQHEGVGFIDESGHPRYFTVADGLVHNDVWGIVSDSAGRVWVSTKGGVGCYEGGIWYSFTPQLGLSNATAWPLLIYQDRLYIGTLGAGVSILDVSTLMQPHPRVDFREPGDRNDETVVYWDVLAPWAEIPSQRIECRYRIDGGLWGRWTLDRQVIFRGLPSGEHRLEVQPKGLLGAGTDGVRVLLFKTFPPFYLRPVFFLPIGILCALLVGLVINGFVRKRAYDAKLRAQEALYRTVVETQGELIFRMRPDGTITFVNDAFCAFFGHGRTKLVGRPIRQIVPAANRNAMMIRLSQVTAHFPVVAHDLELVDHTGRKVWLHMIYKAVLDPFGTILEIQAIGQDVTERKETEEALRDSESRLAEAQRLARLGSYQYNFTDGQVAWSEETFSITGWDPSRQPPGIREFLQMIHPEDREGIRSIMDAAMRNGIPFECTYRIEAGDGILRYIQSAGKPIADASGRVVQLFGTIMDITERKKAEEQITTSLKEKEVLLKEIHHRVKNNLQVISSLLNLQSAAIKDSSDLEVFRESQHRVRSMALIHEKLYQSESLASVNFEEYVNSLATHLLRSYNPPGVSVQVDAHGILLDVDTAIPCGLIINELVSNSLKHAFPDGRCGIVRVIIESLIGHCFRLTVSDDGIGFPAGIDPSTTKSLGLQLVHVLAEQLAGTVVVTKNSGTSTVIEFSGTRQEAPA